MLTGEGKANLFSAFICFAQLKRDRMNKKRQHKNPMSKPYKPKYLRHALLTLSGLPIETWGSKQEFTYVKRS